jgi:hypothetical protein
MRSTISGSGRRRAAGGVIAAAAFALAAPGSALGADAVFGGSTAAGEPIVLEADRKAKKLKSVVIAWEAKCDGGQTFPMATRLTATRAQAGFQPDPGELAVSRNARAGFAGRQAGAMDLGNAIAVVSADYSGRLRRGRASGRLAGEVTILDRASGNQIDACRTGEVSWSATRAAGRIYAGATSQDEPIVVRLDARRAKVADLLVSWHSSTCEPPDRFLRFAERFGGFPVKAGRFGDTFEQQFTGDQGNSIVYSYELGGTIARRAARGSLRVRMTNRDAAGVAMVSCDSGGIAWSAATG